MGPSEAGLDVAAEMLLEHGDGISMAGERLLSHQQQTWPQSVLRAQFVSCA